MMLSRLPWFFSVSDLLLLRAFHMKEAVCDPLRKHTEHSPDLDAIEAWWNRLRQRLQKTAPSAFESRQEFHKRLQRTVAWLNERQRREGRRLFRGQKQRARAVLRLVGAKCKY